MKLAILFLFCPVLFFGQVENVISSPKAKEKVFLPVKSNSNDDASFLVKNNSFIYSFLSSFFIILLFLLLVFLLLKYFSKKRSLNLSNSSNNAVFKILASFAFNSNKQINLIQIASRIYIIAVFDNSFTLLDKITDSKEIELLQNICSKKENIDMQRKNLYFFDIIKNLLNKNKINKV